ncbi:MAG: hypothetical protein WA860_14095 [Acidimicrobiales bacterium]
MRVRRSLEFDRENEAAWIISAVLSGLPHRLDTRSKAGKSMECDFAIDFVGGTRAVLEVTSSTVEKRAQQVKLVGSGAWECPGITRNWSVTLEGAGHDRAGARISRFKSLAPPYFSILEQECPLGYGDLLHYDVSVELSPSARAAISSLNELGAPHGSLLDKPPYGSPHVYLGWAYADVNNDPSLNEVVESAALSNQKKLERYSDSQRHLFIWIDQTDYRNAADLFTFNIPKESPTLPTSIDRVWVGPWSPGINYEGSLHSLISSNGRDPWIQHVNPRVSAYYESNDGKSLVKLDHLTKGVHPFGSSKPWRLVPEID